MRIGVRGLDARATAGGAPAPRFAGATICFFPFFFLGGCGGRGGAAPPRRQPAGRRPYDSPALRFVCPLFLSWEVCGILVNAFAEASAHAGCEAYAGFAEFVAQAIGGGHRIFPSLLAVAFEQVDLIRLGTERGGLHAEKTNLRALLPILAEEGTDLLEDFRVELGWGRQGVRAGDGGEVFIAEFELDRARVEMGFAQAAAHHLGKSHQGGFELAAVGRVFVVGVLVADGFGADVSSNFGVEPATGIFASGLTGQSETPFSEAVGEIGFLEAG